MHILRVPAKNRSSWIKKPWSISMLLEKFPTCSSNACKNSMTLSGPAASRIDPSTDLDFRVERTAFMTEEAVAAERSAICVQTRRRLICRDDIAVEQRVWINPSTFDSMENMWRDHIFLTVSMWPASVSSNAIWVCRGIGGGRSRDKISRPKKKFET